MTGKRDNPGRYELVRLVQWLVEFNLDSMWEVQLVARFGTSQQNFKIMITIETEAHLFTRIIMLQKNVRKKITTDKQTENKKYIIPLPLV